MPSRPHKGQSGKLSSKAGTARKLKTKKRMVEDWQRRTRWKCNGGRGEAGGDLGTKKDGKKLFAADVMQKAPESVVHEHMSQGEKVRSTKKQKNVKGWSTEDMKDKANRSFGGRHRRNEDVESFEPRGNGSMLEEVGGKNGGGSSGQVQGRGQQQGR